MQTDESAHVKANCLTSRLIDAETGAKEKVPQLVGRKCKIKC